MQGRIASAVHAGRLRAGDRLPSIREVAHACGVSSYAAAKAYTALEAEGVVEKRARAGVYLAAPGRGEAADLPETGEWLTQLLVECFEHQIKIPLLPDLIRRYTALVTVRCACVESTRDHLTALEVEVSEQFGIETHSVSVDELDGLPDRIPFALKEADVLVTTAYHAPQVRAAAEALHKPLVVVTIHPRAIADVERRLKEAGELTVVCADSTFGERFRAIHGGAHADRIRVVLADDREAIDALDRAQPVVLTMAAREQLQDACFRLVTPHRPAFSREFARAMSDLLIRCHLQAMRAALQG